MRIILMIKSEERENPKKNPYPQLVHHKYHSAITATELRTARTHQDTIILLIFSKYLTVLEGDLFVNSAKYSVRQ